MTDDRLYLIHIQEAVARIEEYVQGGREAFMQSRLIQDAVIRNLQTLAESTQRLSGEFKHQHPDMDWRAIAGLRNVLVHDYLGVDVARVWKIVQEQLPRLKQQLPELPSGPNTPRP
ncbi:MAG: DUF86 domain-containing protein [Planctomycetes bacterium]|nr:DUF86 domain-containing protein [Planctomycetota bacterium]